MYLNPEIEKLELDLLRKLQLERLNQALGQARQSPFYREKLKSLPQKGLTSLADLKELPFTTKEDLRQNFPFGFLSLPLDKTVRLHSSSGTTGNPTIVYHSKRDLDNWAELVARCLYMVGARPGMIFQNMMSYGLFTGGLGFHYGAERLGLLTIPIGPGNTQRQIWFLKQFKTSVIHVLPSYALRLSQACQEMGIAVAKDLNLKIAIIGAEPHPEATRQRIEEGLGVKAYNCYGLSELCGPGVAFECLNQAGLHVWEDQFYLEIIEPKTGRVLPDGEEGELVLTSLNREAMPLIRFRTRDLTAVIPEPCSCGRSHRRIKRLKGRNDDMLIVNGVNIFPIQIEKVLMQIPGLADNYQIELHKENYMDRLIVKVEVKPILFNDSYPFLEKLSQEITEKLKAEITVTPQVKLVETGTLPISEGKAKRVIDLRQLEKH